MRVPPFPRAVRALDVLAAAPAGCIIHRACNDANDPHIRSGEAVVVDPRDCEPASGELFLVGWSSGRQSIRQARQRREKIFRDDQIVEADVWWLRAIGHHRLVPSEGPIIEAGMSHLILGRVVGLYDPSFQMPEISLPASLQARLRRS